MSTERLMLESKLVKELNGLPSTFIVTSEFVFCVEPVKSIILNVSPSFSITYLR